MSFTQNRGINTRYCRGCFHKCKYGHTTINGKVYPMLGDTVIKCYKAPGDFAVFVNVPDATAALKLVANVIAPLCDLNQNHR